MFNKTSKKDKLVTAFQEMSVLTKPECQHKCRVPLSCCSPEYCNMAIDMAKEDWNVKLEATPQYAEGKTKLPLMGLDGCIAAPHFRPLCTLHTCAINNIATSGDLKWDKNYFKLRNKISKLSSKVFGERG